MKYKIHYGKAGTYGETKTTEYRDLASQPIATVYWLSTTQVTIILYTSRGAMHSRTGPRDNERIEAICEAWLNEQGYTEKAGETVDVRAYND